MDRATFWATVQIGQLADCWPWRGGRSLHVSMDGLTLQAHRVAFALTFGPLPPVVRRRCQNRLCCNPFHMYASTAKNENMYGAILAAQQMECDLEPIRAAFRRSGRTLRQVALALDWYDCHGRPDAQRAKRALGLVPYMPGRGYPKRLRERCAMDTAVRLAHAIGVDPFEVGL